jgi:maleylacetate reductase
VFARAMMHAPIESARDAMRVYLRQSRPNSSASQHLFDLAKNNGAPVALRDLGIKERDLDKAFEMAMQNQYPNPRPLERIALRALFQNAFEGNRPSA